LLDSQLWIFRKENLRDKNFIWREIARRNRFVVFDVLLGINQNRSRFFCDGMIVGPFRQDFPCGVPQINFDSLVCWKFECNGTFRLIRQRQFDPDLSDLREFYRLWRYLQVKCETAQSWIFVLRDSLGRERMEHAAQPAAPVRCRSRRRFLAQGASHNREHYKEQNDASPHERVKQQTLQILSNPLSIDMKAFCALGLWLLVTLPVGVAKERHCIFRVHVQGNPQDTAIFSTSVRAQLSGKEVAIEKTPWISERDVIAFSPYPAANGTYGALFQLDEHGRVVLDTLSVERRGSLLFVFINGRPITELAIDKRVSDGKIYIASGLTAADINLMKKDWRLLGQRKR
jgi:hypothetical protein